MITRFAPSPTGPLHLGHAFSAITAYDMAQSAGGTFLLRIEDIDQSRARPEWENQIFDDLHWLGLSWSPDVLRQSQNMNAYSHAIDQISEMHFCYSCSCSRRDIQNAISAPQEGVAFGPDGIIYPGTCRTPNDQKNTLQKDTHLRLNMQKAARDISFTETGQNARQKSYLAQDLTDQVGDIVLCRQDMGTSYHLSVVVDDAAQGVTHVIRGADLQEATKIHVLLQNLLGLPTPIYYHHPLIRDEAGKRLAKRDDAKSIAKFRSEGATPKDIRTMVGL